MWPNDDSLISTVYSKGYSSTRNRVNVGRYYPPLNLMLKCDSARHYTDLGFRSFSFVYRS